MTVRPAVVKGSGNVDPLVFFKRMRTNAFAAEIISQVERPGAEISTPNLHFRLKLPENNLMRFSQTAMSRSCAISERG